MVEGRENLASSCAAGMREKATAKLKSVPASRVKGGGEMVAMVAVWLNVERHEMVSFERFQCSPPR